MPSSRRIWLRPVLCVIFALLICCLLLIVPFKPTAQSVQKDSFNQTTQKADMDQSAQKADLKQTAQKADMNQSDLQPEKLQSMLDSALAAFSHANTQQVNILSQSTADPVYNTPEKLLQYPGAAWEFDFFRNKTAEIFIYHDAMDTDYLNLYKKDNILWSNTTYTELAALTPPPANSWSKVKSALLSEEPYRYTRVNSLDELPFLFLHSKNSIIGTPTKTKLNGQECYLLQVQPQLPQSNWHTGSLPNTSELPKEISFWVTCTNIPQLLQAQYFWVLSPPGGTMYTVNAVTFRQKQSD